MPTRLSPSRAARTPFALVLALLAACSPLGAQDNADDARRVIEHLQVKPGMTLAEVGAGSGELTVSLAQAVGASGRVYSNEISESRRVAIRTAVAHARLDNVTVVRVASRIPTCRTRAAMASSCATSIITSPNPER